MAKALRVQLGRNSGFTRDISTSGIFFELKMAEGLGIPVNFTVELETPAGKMKLKCTGEIVRVEPGEKAMGLAVKITDSMLVEA